MPGKLGVLVKMLLPQDISVADTIVFRFYYSPKPEKLDPKRELFFYAPKTRRHTLTEMVEKRGTPILMGSASVMHNPKKRVFNDISFYPFSTVKDAFEKLGIGSKERHSIAVLLERNFSGYKMGHFGRLTVPGEKNLRKAGIEPKKLYALRDYRRLWASRIRSMRKKHARPR
ncbi:MAG: hypothetical protein JW772_01205 [Candidatus Diapherotrites archaeon]|nr:hypothetical protein [Candidatus Diapherotrites archaeon]